MSWPVYLLCSASPAYSRLVEVHFHPSSAIDLLVILIKFLTQVSSSEEIAIPAQWFSSENQESAEIYLGRAFSILHNMYKMLS